MVTYKIGNKTLGVTFWEYLFLLCTVFVECCILQPYSDHWLIMHVLHG